MCNGIRRCLQNKVLVVFITALSLCEYSTILFAQPDVPIGLRGPGQVVSDPKPLNFKVNYVYRTGGKGQPKLIEDGGVLQSGDHYKIQFTPREDSFVYIFQIDSTNTVYHLFPMEKWKNVALKNRNPVKAGVTYSLPSENRSFVLDKHNGLETIYFVATREDDPDIARLIEQLRNARKQGNKLQDELVQRELTNNLTTRGPAGTKPDPDTKTEFAWTPEETFSLSTQRLDNLCAQCSSKLTFRHQ